MPTAPLDLSRLALERSPQGDPAVAKPRPRRWLSRYVLPAMLLFGFIALVGAAAGRRLLPSRSVTVVPVIVKRAAAPQAGTTLFQAAGWIEPRPTAISIAALTPGIIEELLVVGGQRISKGEPIARLISLDADIMVQLAIAALENREGELNRAKAERDAAKIRLENPVHLQVQLADAQSTLAKTKTELAKLPFLIDSAAASVKYARSNMEGKLEAREAIAGRLIEQSQSEHAAAHAVLRELQQREPNLKDEIQALQNKVNALQQQLTLLVEETRQLREAEAKVQSCLAVCSEGKLQVRQAELALERNVIRAPMDGRILRLVASPGTRVMGLESTAGQSSSTVAEMYDPGRLQVRADVRLEDVPLVTPGQPVEIHTASFSEAIHGRVLQATSTASIQKNTLEVKVELIDPPLTATPEMLVTANFLAPPDAGITTEPNRVHVRVCEVF